jgi:hypothetical protein
MQRFLEKNMDAKTTRKYLADHARASKDIELTEAAISILERVSGCNGVIETLKKKQQAQLRKIDAAAEKLGAPYGA